MKHFIEFVSAQTHQFFNSNPNVISTRRTCSQRSGMAAGSKRRVLAFCFPVLICYMFPISKYRGEWDLGLCMTSGLAKRMLLRVASSDESCGQTRLKLGSWHCVAAFSLQVPKSCTHLDPIIFYISILGTWSKLVRENKILALSVCLPQPCPSAGRRFAASRSRLNHY